MKGEDFLEIAKALLQMKSEAALRSAIGRAYYALSNAAAQLLREWEIAVAQGPRAFMATFKTLSPIAALSVPLTRLVH